MPRSLARGELTTALDLLSVLSAPRDPPDVDVASLPLPQQTLSALPTVPPPPPPALDPQQNPLAPLPLASSLDALSRSARAFFGASEALVPLSDEELAVLAASSSSASAAPRAPPRQRARPRAPDPWPTILRLHHASPRPLVPLGAAPGASLAAGKGESRTARSVGVFFGAQEARAGARAGAVARVGELLEEGAAERSGRRLVVEVEGAAAVGERERVVWGQEDEVGLDGGEDAAEEMDKVERVLRARGNAVFAEELFAQVRLALFLSVLLTCGHTLTCVANSSRPSRARTARCAPSCSWAAAPRATPFPSAGAGGPSASAWCAAALSPLSPLSRSSAHSLSTHGPHARPQATTPERSTAAHPTASLVSSLLRLLFLQSYAARRDSPAATPRPLLATVAAFLGHAQRERALKGLLERLRARAAEAEGVEAVAEVDGEAEGRDGDGAGRRHAADVLQVLDGAAVLGGRATLRVGNRCAPFGFRATNVDRRVAHPALTTPAAPSSPCCTRSLCLPSRARPPAGPPRRRRCCTCRSSSSRP